MDSFQNKLRQLEMEAYLKRLKEARKKGCVDTSEPSSIQRHKKFSESIREKAKTEKDMRIKVENMKLLNRLRKINTREFPDYDNKFITSPMSAYMADRQKKLSRIEWENAKMYQRIQKTRPSINSGMKELDLDFRKRNNRRSNLVAKSKYPLQQNRRKERTRPKSAGRHLLRGKLIYSETVKIAAFLVKLRVMEVKTSNKHFLRILATDEKDVTKIYGKVEIDFELIERRYGSQHTPPNSGILAFTQRKTLVLQLLGYLDIERDKVKGIRIFLKKTFEQEANAKAPVRAEWSPQETRNLIRGVRKYDTNWRAIMNDSKLSFHPSRTRQALSKRWNELLRAFEKQQQDALRDVNEGKDDGAEVPNLNFHGNLNRNQPWVRKKGMKSTLRQGMTKNMASVSARGSSGARIRGTAGAHTERPVGIVEAGQNKKHERKAATARREKLRTKDRVENDARFQVRGTTFNVDEKENRAIKDMLKILGNNNSGQNSLSNSTAKPVATSGRRNNREESKGEDVRTSYDNSNKSLEAEISQGKSIHEESRKQEMQHVELEKHISHEEQLNEEEALESNEYYSLEIESAEPNELKSKKERQKTRVDRINMHKLSTDSQASTSKHKLLQKLTSSNTSLDSKDHDHSVNYAIEEPDDSLMVSEDDETGTATADTPSTHAGAVLEASFGMLA